MKPDRSADLNCWVFASFVPDFWFIKSWHLKGKTERCRCPKNKQHRKVRCLKNKKFKISVSFKWCRPGWNHMYQSPAGGERGPEVPGHIISLSHYFLTHGDRVTVHTSWLHTAVYAHCAAVYVIHHQCHSRGRREPVPLPAGGLGHLEGCRILHCVYSCKRVVFRTGLSYMLFMPVFLRLPQRYILDSRGVKTHPTLCFHKTTNKGSLSASNSHFYLVLHNLHSVFVFCFAVGFGLVLFFFLWFYLLIIHAEVL